MKAKVTVTHKNGVNVEVIKEIYTCTGVIHGDLLKDAIQQHLDIWNLISGDQLIVERVEHINN